MPLTNAEKSKRFREKNPERYKEQQKQYYEHNGKIKSNDRVIRFRLYKSECKRLLNILLE